ncbi:SDR family NAD(P)-dependent oxidoreductase, partial [Salmonella enterica]
LGRRFMAIQADLRQQDVLSGIVTQTVAAFGRVDILVNNAGTIRRQDALDFSEKDWDDVMNLNLKSVFFLSQAVARQFVAQGNGGKIINIASMLSFQGGIRVPSYTASKSGVLGITRLLANEWAAQGI